MKYNKKSYYRIRNMKLRNNARRAARFIYLNKTCWNGLYRVNRKGKFNVPIGRYRDPRISNEKGLKLASAALQNATIFEEDFEKALDSASKNDLIYVDPPYTTSLKNNGFIEYNSKLFSLADQKRLRDVLLCCKKKGSKIIMNNGKAKVIIDLFSDFNIMSVSRKSVIAADPKRRGEVTELLITSFKIPNTERLKLKMISGRS